jgi:dTDP-4-amino-4,6-dideoxygalactose transaminase
MTAGVLLHPSERAPLAAFDPIPFLDLVEPHRAREEEFVEAFRRALRTAAFVGGPEVMHFEQEFAAYVGTTHAAGVANGTDSLRFIFLARRRVVGRCSWTSIR